MPIEFLDQELPTTGFSSQIEQDSDTKSERSNRLAKLGHDYVAFQLSSLPDNILDSQRILSVREFVGQIPVFGRYSNRMVGIHILMDSIAQSNEPVYPVLLKEFLIWGDKILSSDNPEMELSLAMQRESYPFDVVSKLEGFIAGSIELPPSSAARLGLLLFSGHRIRVLGRYPVNEFLYGLEVLLGLYNANKGSLNQIAPQLTDYLLESKKNPELKRRTALLRNILSSFALIHQAEKAKSILVNSLDGQQPQIPRSLLYKTTRWLFSLKE